VHDFRKKKGVTKEASIKGPATASSSPGPMTRKRSAALAATPPASRRKLVP